MEGVIHHWPIQSLSGKGGRRLLGAQSAFDQFQKLSAFGRFQKIVSIWLIPNKTSAFGQLQKVFPVFGQFQKIVSLWPILKRVVCIGPTPTNIQPLVNSKQYSVFGQFFYQHRKAVLLESVPTEISNPIQPNPIQPNPLIAFGHLSLSIVIRNNASRPRQINVD